MALADAIRAGEDRLAGKKAVIWEFASRELSVGDWKPIDWSAVQAGGAQ
jgi:alginate O-acetyltransferase complex protein AlgJ